MTTEKKDEPLTEAASEAVEELLTQGPGKTIRVLGDAPTRAHESDAGFDLRAVFDHPHDSTGIVIRPGEIVMVKSELRGIELPENVAGLVVPRSGLARKNGLTVLNSPGLIDPGYRGPIDVCLHHAGRVGGAIYPAVHIKPGHRIAQLLFVPFIVPEFELVDSIGESDRGENGWGSSGVE